MQYWLTLATLLRHVDIGWRLFVWVSNATAFLYIADESCSKNEMFRAHDGVAGRL